MAERQIFGKISRLTAAALLLAGAVVMTNGAPASAATPPPSLTLLVDGNPIRDTSVVESGTTVTAVAGGVLNPGSGARELRVDVDPATVYQAGGVTAPEGWTVEWSTDGGATWVGAEPGDPTTVTSVRATAGVDVVSVNQGSQRYEQFLDDVGVPASTFTASTGGDGWDVFFYDDFVLNIFHHSSNIRMDCHLRSTGARCDGFSPYVQFDGYQAGNRSGGWVDGNTGNAYAFTASVATDEPGVLCMDLDTVPVTSCGFTALSGDTNVTNYQALSNAEGAGGRLFGLESVNHKLLCFDPGADAPCANSPVQLAGNGDTARYHVYPLGSKVFASTDTTLYCFETSNLAPCAGAWPATYASLGWTSASVSPVAHMDAAGTIDGICLWAGCLDLAGADQTTGGAWVNPHSITPWAANASVNNYSGRYGRFEATAGRAYLHEVLQQATTDVYCFDYATEAACAGFDTTPTGNAYYLYALRADPNNPNCVWFNSDPGFIGLFDAISGAAECTANPVMTLQPSAFAPRFVCATSGGIDRWISVEMNALNGTDIASSQSLTMRTGNGDAVPGWTGVPLQVAEPLDLSALTVAQTGARPSFNIGFNVTAGSIDSADFTVIYEGRGPELCVDLTVDNTAADGSPNCPVVAALNASLTENLGEVVTRNAPARSFVAGGDATECPEDILFAGPPGPVRNLMLSQTADGCVMTFLPPADDGGSPTRFYEMSVGGGAWQVVAVSGDADGLSAPLGCTIGQRLDIGVRAVNLLGAGEPANASITPQAASAPPPPTSPTTVAPAAEPTVTPTTVASAPPVPVVLPAPVILPANATLPETGADNGDIAVFGALMIGAGVLMLQLSRRRSTRQQ